VDLGLGNEDSALCIVFVVHHPRIDDARPGITCAQDDAVKDHAARRAVDGARDVADGGLQTTFLKWQGQNAQHVPQLVANPGKGIVDDGLVKKGEKCN
jgi:hypothetical protein